MQLGLCVQYLVLALEPSARCWGFRLAATVANASRQQQWRVKAALELEAVLLQRQSRAHFRQLQQQYTSDVTRM
jgi:hypothetical protein